MNPLQKKLPIGGWLRDLYHVFLPVHAKSDGDNFAALKQADLGQARQENSFVDLSFRVMGKLCKQDGNVDMREIAYARELMQKMRLGARATNLAMQAFNEGKQPQWSISPGLNELYRRYKERAWVRQLFLELQFRAAMADGPLTQAELILLKDMAHLLRISSLQFSILKARVERAHQLQHRPAPAKLQALKQLGLPAGASEQDIRMAYKRLISRYHPDRYPQPEVKAQMEHRAREINQAYRLLRDGF